MSAGAQSLKTYFGKPRVNEAPVTLDGETVTRIEFHRSGEGMMWIRWHLEDGTEEDSFVFKGGL